MSNDKKQYPNGSEFIAKKILEDDYEPLFRFFQDAFQWSADFERQYRSDYVVVIITRRCNALFTIFYQIILYYASLTSEKCPKYFLSSLTPDVLGRIKPHFITDECLLANSQEVADFIRNHEYICAPNILILDEMMLHGRTMNRMLGNFVKNVCGILKDNHEESQSYYESLIEDKITIKVFALNDRPLCFLPAYSELPRYLTLRHLILNAGA